MGASNNRGIFGNGPQGGGGNAPQSGPRNPGTSAMGSAPLPMNPYGGGTQVTPMTPLPSGPWDNIYEPMPRANPMNAQQAWGYLSGGMDNGNLGQWGGFNQYLTSLMNNPGLIPSFLQTGANLQQQGVQNVMQGGGMNVADLVRQARARQDAMMMLRQLDMLRNAGMTPAQGFGRLVPL